MGVDVVGNALLLRTSLLIGGLGGIDEWFAALVEPSDHKSVKPLAVCNARGLEPQPQPHTPRDLKPENLLLDSRMAVKIAGG